MDSVFLHSIHVLLNASLVFVLLRWVILRVLRRMRHNTLLAVVSALLGVAVDVFGAHLTVVIMHAHAARGIADIDDVIDEVGATCIYTAAVLHGLVTAALGVAEATDHAEHCYDDAHLFAHAVAMTAVVATQGLRIRISLDETAAAFYALCVVSVIATTVCRYSRSETLYVRVLQGLEVLLATPPWIALLLHTSIDDADAVYIALIGVCGVLAANADLVVRSKLPEHTAHTAHTAHIAPTNDTPPNSTFLSGKDESISVDTVDIQ